MQQRYSLGAIVLHWLIAALLAFQLAVGLGLDDLGPSGFALYQLHKSIGILVLVLTLLRIGWRLFAPRPPKLEHGWQGTAAATVHFALYLFMLGAPLTGWLMVSTDRVKVPTLLFGTLPWPHLPAPARLNGFAHVSHAVLGWIGIALVLLHVAGALRHQWLLRDNLMRRMAPGRGLWLALAALVPIGWLLGMAALWNVGPAPTKKAMPEPAGRAAPADPQAPPANVAVPTTAPATPDVGPANVATSTPTAPPHWAIQPGGTLAFSVGNGDARIEGRFTRWSGAILFDPDRPEGANIRITVDLVSASVGDATQDAMLAGADFLDAAAHPRAVYRTTAVRRTGPNRYAATGTLSLKGQSRPVALSFTLSGADAARHVEGRAIIDRAAFGIGTGDNGKTLAGDVTLNFRFDAARKGTE